MEMNKLVIPGVVLFVSLLVSCGGGGGDAPNDPPKDPPIEPPKDHIAAVTNCTPTADDSPEGVTANRINSIAHGSPVYHSIAEVRQGLIGESVSIDYMVHPAVGTAKGLLVLLTGGNGDAEITGSEGATPDTAGGNFLIRSAHLYAARGYKVVTVDRPSDHASSGNIPFNKYRASVNHAVDLSRIINAELGDQTLPVILGGTSRGAISTVAQHKLADAIAISAPVTNDDKESAAVYEASLNPNLRPSSVGVPAHVMWHQNDACFVSPPAGSKTLVTDFNPTAANNPVSGGYDATDKVNDCNGNSVHGFFGIESCAVGLETTWMDGLKLTAALPVLNVPGSVEAIGVSETIDITVGHEVAAANGGALSYSLPFTTTSLGGSVTISGNTVTYTAPAFVGGSTEDSFVYIVTEAGGGKRSGIARVIVNPPM